MLMVALDHVLLAMVPDVAAVLTARIKGALAVVLLTVVTLKAAIHRQICVTPIAYWHSVLSILTIISPVLNRNIAEFWTRMVLY